MQDPLKPTSEVQKELFQGFAKLANQKSIDEVLGAAANLITNCIRQNYGKRDEAQRLLTELYGKNMELLLMHYDSVTGRRRSVIPFDQVIAPPHFVDKDSF